MTESSYRDYRPPWGGRGVYLSLCLHMLRILGRPADLYDLRRLPGLTHASDTDLAWALGRLEESGQVQRAITPIHFGIGCTYPCHDVTVWCLSPPPQEGGPP